MDGPAAAMARTTLREAISYTSAPSFTLLAIIRKVSAMDQFRADNDKRIIQANTQNQEYSYRRRRREARAARYSQAESSSYSHKYDTSRGHTQATLARNKDPCAGAWPRKAYKKMRIDAPLIRAWS